MPCYHPIDALQPTAGGRLIFPTRETRYLYNDYRDITIPCGQCYGCRLERSRDWAARCMHEKQMHKYSCFVTLTYDEKHLPADLSLNHQHPQQFLKRLRRATTSTRHQQNLLLEREYASRLINQLIANYRCADVMSELICPSGTKAAIRFYLGGEYGEREGRPHYHAILFGVDFADKKHFKKTPAGFNIYTSKTLSHFWPHGFSSVGELTFESAAYVARYIMKKLTGDGNKTSYEIIDLETGQINKKKKEYNSMSKRPAIGSSFLRKYSSDIYTTGKMIMRGHKSNPPRYYDKLYEKIDAAAMENLRHGRYLEGLLYTTERTDQRLKIQETVATAKTNQLKRGLT